MPSHLQPKCVWARRFPRAYWGSVVSPPILDGGAPLPPQPAAVAQAWRDYSKGRFEARTAHSHNGVVAE
jgi:hypothetical protein